MTYFSRKENSLALYFYKLSNSRGGAERRIIELANYMAAKGLNVQLISLDNPQDTASYYLDNKINWHKLGHDHSFLGKFIRILKIVNLFHIHKVSVLIGFVMSSDKTVYLASLMSRVKIIAAERNAPEMYKIKNTPAQTIQVFALLHFCSKVVVQFQDYIPSYPKTLRGRIIALPNPVTSSIEFTSRALLPVADSRFILLAVGRLDPIQKGFECLVYAFDRVSKLFPDWDLVIVGEGHSKESLSRLILDLDLSQRIKIFPNTNKIRDYYYYADLYVMPSLWEGFPNALAEAMSHGLPAVGFSDSPGVNNLINNGSTGWLAAEFQSPASLAQALSAAMSNPLERMRRGHLAKASMTIYSPEAIYQRWFELVSNVVA